MRVSGIGPSPCRIVVCGEGPGWQEDRDGKPFVGKTGDELNRFLADLGLSRREVFLTNLFREFKGKDYVYTSEDLARDEPELLAELKRAKPQIIIPLGRYATRWFMGDVDMDDVWGIPWYLPEETVLPDVGKLAFLSKDTTVLPIHHPAAGFHNSEMAAYTVAGFKRLGEFLRGESQARKLYDDPYPEPVYEEITTVERLGEVLRGVRQTESQGGADRSVIRLGSDSEGYARKPWSLQFSFVPGVAYLLRASSHDVVRAFADWLRRNRKRVRIIFHSSLHDLPVFRSLGIDLIDLGVEIDDTMVMAYLLQIEPQGLKPLSTRHCNMRMQSYDEVLGDASQRLAADYLTWLYDMEQEDYERRCEEEFIRLTTTPYVDSRGKTQPGRRLKVHPKLPKSDLFKSVSRCLQSKDARKLWLKQVEDIQVAGYNRLGSMPEATLDYVPVATAVHYGARDADATVRVEPELGRRIDALGLREVYRLELGTYPLIDRMQRIGIKPDLAHFAALSTRLVGEIEDIRGRLVDATGDPDFNANSGDQVAAFLFDSLGLDGGKKTREGRFSTNDKILEGLEREYGLEVITDIRAYREVFKLKNTFVDRLPDFVHRYPFDGRIHSTFRTTRVVTGRLAASDPNLLAMPKHGKFAKDFRRGWVPEPGHVLGSWDLSQIELRVLATLSQDPVMLAIFRGEMRNPDGSKIDLHAALAERIFGVKPKDQDGSKHRLPAKAVNFGLPMGMTNMGLAVELRKNGVMVDEDDAQRWIDETMRLYKGVPAYQKGMIEEARRNGYIRCLSGRIRYIGGIRSRDERVRSEAERFAFSTPIQEGAQWVMKQNEASIWEDILVPYWRQGRWIEPLIQIHDDMVMEFENEDLAREVNPLMVECMTQTAKGLSVPIETSGDWGLNWADFKEF
jgi:uracil-DNA glycosylase family 4